MRVCTRSGCSMRASTSTPSTSLGPGRLNRLWSATNTAPALTAGRDHQPGSATRSQACRMPAATLAPHGDSTSTSGAYSRTWAQVTRTGRSPGSCHSSTPPASSFRSGSHCPPRTRGVRPSRESTRGRRGAWATATATARSLARSLSTTAVASAATPATWPTCRILSRAAARVRGARVSTKAGVRAEGPRRPARCRAACTLPASASQVAQASWVSTSPGCRCASAATSISKALRPCCLKACMAASTWAGVRERQSTRERDTTGSCAASAGQSHWSDTPTTRGPRPRAHRISVPLGSRLTMLSLGSGRERLKGRARWLLVLLLCPPPPAAPGHVLPCRWRSSMRPGTDEL
mmetsp:Transcript_3565/g.10366  ORF Transcript_3565/g.10366 Transcript_3565/m.10366 type:complete len:349 (-) Transcript_3565:2725-3771(-)